MRSERQGAGARRACILLLAIVLAACGTTKKPTTAKAPDLSGKYYADDGPPERVPDNLMQIPDATPADEPFHKYANRPYTVFGQTYVPVANKEPRKERGIASWYGRKFQGQRTSSGEPYDMFAMTAAHRTLPIPSFAKVTNVKNGKSVIVRINDRGPFHPDRIIDLSYAAAAKIGIVNAGSGLVEVERVFSPENKPPSDVSASSLPPDTLPAAATITPPAAAVAMPSVQTAMIAQDPGGLWLQLGAFSSAEGADAFRQKMARELPWLLEPLQVVPRDGLHRVRAGPYKNRDEAAAIAAKLRESLGYAPLLTQ